MTPTLGLRALASVAIVLSIPACSAQNTTTSATAQAQPQQQASRYPPDVTDSMFEVCQATFAAHAKSLCDAGCCAHGTPRVFAYSAQGEVLESVPPVITGPRACPTLDGNEVAYYRVALRDEPERMVEGEERVVVWNTYSNVVTDEIIKASLDTICMHANQSTSGLVVEVYHRQPKDFDTALLTNATLPDVVFSKITRLAQWVRKGAIMDLMPFLQSEYEKSGNLPTADAFPSFQQLLQVESHYYGMPYTVDSRYTIFNPVTAGAVQKPIPPFGVVNPPTNNAHLGRMVSAAEYAAWGLRSSGEKEVVFEGWTWDAMFDRYLHPIKNATQKPSFVFEPGENEEQSFITALGIAEHAMVFRQSEGRVRCGLTEPKFQAVLQKYLPKFKEVMDPNWYPADSAQFQAWKSSWTPTSDPTTLGIPFDSHFFDDDASRPPLNGFAFSTRNDVYPESNSTDLPGGVTIFSGTGFGVTINSTHGRTAYELLFRLMNPVGSPYAHISALKLRQFPAFRKAFDLNYYNAEINEDVYYSLYPRYHSALLAVNSFFPHGPSTTAMDMMVEMEDARVFRSLLLELLVMNVTVQAATERACAVIDRLLLPLCRASDLVIDYTAPCDEATEMKLISFKKPPTCRDGVDLPKPFPTECLYPGQKGTRATVVYVLSGIGIAYSLAVGALTWQNRTARSLRSASPSYCLLMLVGCVMVLASNILFAGPPDQPRLTAGVWMLFLGYGITYSALAVKLYRIQAIFQTKGSAHRVQLTDQRLLLPFVLLVAADTLLLVLYTLLLPLHPTTRDTALPIRELSITRDIPLEIASNFTTNIALIVLYVANCVLLLGMNVATSWRIRNVPSSFKESKFVFAASVMQAAMGVIVLPMVLFVLDKMADRFILWALATVFSVVFFVSVFFVPKILNAYGILLTSTSNAATYATGATTGLGTKRPSTRASAHKGASSTSKSENDCEGGFDVKLQELENELQEARQRETVLREKLVKLGNPHEFRENGKSPASRTTSSALSSRDFDTVSPNTTAAFLAPQATSSVQLMSSTHV